MSLASTPPNSHTPAGNLPASRDISVIIPAHREASLLHRTLHSVLQAITQASQHGITCEVIVVLDRADDETRHIAHHFAQSQKQLPLQIVEADVGDPGLAREVGRRVATGNFIALVDGDDLLGKEWLASAFAMANSSPQALRIYHAEHQVYFEAENFLVRYRPSHGADSNGFQPHFLAATNPWTSLLFFPREPFAGRPFAYISRNPQQPHQFGYGYEDWHWLAEQIAMGAEVHIVPDTCNFVRRKKSASSILKQDSRGITLLPPTTLLDPVTLASAPSQATTTPPAKNSKLKKLLQKAKALTHKHCPELLGLAKRISSTFKMLVRKRQKSLKANAPTWQVQLWQSCLQMHAIEPQIFPSGHLLAPAIDHLRRPPPLAAKYLAACQAIHKRPTHVLIIPWLKKGGADLEVLHYVRALQSTSKDHTVLVITTNDSDSPWAKRLSPEVMVLPLGSLLADVSQEDQIRTLGTLLVQLKAPVIHLVNSRLGYATVNACGDAIRNQSQIFASCFCEDITSDGRTSGFAFEEQPEVYRHLSGIFADNQTILDKLQATYGYSSEKLFLHYMPIDQAEPINIPPRDTLQVLWAGRLDRQKRPDLLRKITEKLAGQPIHFTIYGSPVLERKANYKNWVGLKNVTYQGPYDGFESLPLEQFDLLLHTAQWEGLPNILLEAYTHGLPVVASGVGGVPELVKTGENGHCITPFDDVNAYCDALIQLQQNRQLLTKFATSGRNLVANRHSWAAFLQTLAQVPGYLAPRTLDAASSVIERSTKAA
ncbi:MAG: glycosyltransferase [Planctomycetaceae bacterium]